MLRYPVAILVLVVCLGLAAVSMGAPSLDIRKSPVTGGTNAGPNPLDPNALQGQWFTNLSGQNPEVRPYEFYDNVSGSGGGTSSSDAIYGVVTNIVYAGGAERNILSFDINATITNDTNTVTGTWADGSNTHTEALSTTQRYEGTMYDTYLTSEFAADENNQPSSYASPAVQQSPQILAQNHDNLAWFCYNELEDTGLGGYWVPTWDFGDIALGQSSNVTMSFTVSGDGLESTDSRYQALETSAGGQDILLNRTTSLKISNWEEKIDLDDGTAYPSESSLLYSDVSVFHNVPVPATMSVLAVGVFGFLRRRRG